MNKEIRGLSYKDPLYDSVEAELEKEYGLPQGGIAAIRTRGEKSNADEVSKKGARTVYQIMPATRKLFLDKYGVDAYESPEAAARVAALHLKESMDRNGGDWAEAVGEYHGGPNRDDWGPVNRAYRARVLGSGNTETPESRQLSLDIDPMDLITKNAAQLQGPAADAVPEVRTAEEVVAAALGNSQLDTQSANSLEREENYLKAAKEREENTSAWDRLVAASDEVLTHLQIADLIDRSDGDTDLDYIADYVKNSVEIESFAQNDHEVSLLRRARNMEQEMAARQQIMASRENRQQISTAWSPLLLQLGVGIADPLAWAAGLGVGKGLQMANVGSVALRQGGRSMASVGSAAAEGVIADVGLTAGLDLVGEDIYAGDYLISAVTGAGIGAVIGTAGNLFGKDTYTPELIEGVRKQLQQQKEELYTQARNELGEDALESDVAIRANEIMETDYLESLEYALAEIPESQRLGGEGAFDSDGNLQQRVAESGDIEGIRNDTERALVEETIARAIRITDANPVDKEALKTIIQRLGVESTSNRLLSSENPVLRAVGTMLIENGQGAAGRHRSAALTQHIREQAYMAKMGLYDGLSNQYSRSIGVGRVRDFVDGKGRNRFNREVAIEIEKRNGTEPGVRFSDNPYVNEAADLVETGMTMMGMEQKKAGTIGAVRLPDTGRGYMPHRLDPAKVVDLTPKQFKRVRGIVSQQFQKLEGFDKEFSDDLAKDYVGRGQLSAHGKYAVPFDVTSPEGAEVVRDVLKGRQLDDKEIEAIMGKFSRGGAGHTKKRLKIDLLEDIGDGMQLIDLFQTDIPSLYRSYASRVSGEVALAGYGIMGKQGLEIIEKAAIKTGAAPKETDALKAVFAELLNTPYNKSNQSNGLDNVRAAVSASRLGGMVFTQFAETGNVIPALGVNSALRGVQSMPRLMKEIRDMVATGQPPSGLLKELDAMGGGMGLDGYHSSRMFDVKDNTVEVYNGTEMGLLSRTIRAGAHANVVMSGQRLMLAAQTRFIAEEVLRKSFKYLREGGPDKLAKAFDDMGIDAELRAAMLADMDRVATFDNKGNITALTFKDSKALTPQLINRLHLSLERASGQMIQRNFTGETGLWMHSSLQKILFQFRAFPLVAVEKQWGRNVKNYGHASTVFSLLACMSFAAPIYMARVGMKAAAMEKGKAEEYLDRNLAPQAILRATLNYASAAGFAGDIIDFGASGISSVIGDEAAEALGLETASGRYGGNQGKFSRTIPAVGFLDDATSGDFKKTVKVLPGANNPAAFALLEALERLTED